MRKNKLLISIFMIWMVLILSGCEQKDPVPNIPEPSQNEPSENEPEPNNKFQASVEKVEIYNNKEISDWIDEDNVIVSKENESLEKMQLQELSDHYPKSIYSYSFDTKEYTLLKEQDNIFLIVAKLSPDKKYLLFEGISLGDPIFYMMDLDTLNVSTVSGAYSVSWSDDNKVIGASYHGGAIEVASDGEINPLAPEIDDSLFIVRKYNDKVFYNTNEDTSLMMFDLDTNQQNDLDISDVFNIIPSPDADQLLILQDNGTLKSLLLTDNKGQNPRKLVEGQDIKGISWSPDKKIIAYNLTGNEDGITEKGIFLLDVESGESIEIISDIDTHSIIFSPSGNRLVYLEQNEFNVNSTLVDLKYNND